MKVLKSVWRFSMQPIGSPWTGKGGKWVGEFSISKIGSREVLQSQKGPMCLSSRWQFEHELELLTTELCWEQVYSVVWPHCHLALDLMPVHTVLSVFGIDELDWQMAPVSTTINAAGKEVSILLGSSPQENYKTQENYIIISSSSKC